MVDGKGLAGRFLALALAAAILGGCIKTMIADSSSSGGTVFSSDEDPDLVREALPFGLKFQESLLADLPEHRGLLLALARGFTAYAYLIQQEADEIDKADYRRARVMRARARDLYIRARDYALRGLGVEHAGFGAHLRKDHAAVLAQTDGDDIEFLYWAGASWGAALGVAKDDLDLIAEAPLAEAMVKRVLEIDETYDRGAAHEFLVSYEGSRPGGSAEVARSHYDRALELSGGARASTYLALATSVVLSEQNLTEFRRLIALALAVDPDAAPELRLVNTVSHRRALLLQSRISDLFFDAE